jgi:hypothetical protein
VGLRFFDIFYRFDFFHCFDFFDEAATSTGSTSPAGCGSPG